MVGLREPSQKSHLLTSDPVPSGAYILKKYRGNPPSLIVHLHPMHFRFDQQDGSFSYQSEMRVFIEHLQKGTIPHDMLEEFRKANVKFYDGWLIVRVVDHKSVAKTAATTGMEAEDDKPFSIHNYNTFITPSPYVPYPKQASIHKSPVMKQENGVSSDKQTNGEHPSSSTVNGEPGSDDSVRPSSRPGKPQPRVFHVALRPTTMSKHMDLMLASMDLDPKATLNRKQSQIFTSARTPGSSTGAMVAPLSLDAATAGEKGQASKKRKLRIAPDQMIYFERSVINHTAPPLDLSLVNSLEEAELKMLSHRDSMHDQEPPSPKSRKRTVAELAADDALAKEQERFMLVMAERDGGVAGANAGVVDGQAAAAMFQPDFGKFNTIQQIKFQAAEKQKREEERRMHDDANKRLQEEERKRHQEAMRLQQQQAAQQAQQAERARQAMEQRKSALQAAAAAQQQQQQLQMQQQMQAQQAQQAQANAQQMSQLSGVPPNMQNQIRQGQSMSSPVMRQSTPHGNSSPIVNNGQPQAVPMATQGSQQGMSGSPGRPGSAMQHGHPGAAMTRGPSNQGPSRNGTPQLPHNTPAMRQATPVMRQGTPAQRLSQASPHPGMMAPTPQMAQAQMMAPGQQMPNGMHYPQNAAQLAAMQQRHNAMQQQAMQNGMMAGNPQLAQAQMAHLQAQRHANADQQAAILQQRQRNAQAAAQQAQMQQAQQQQMGTPQQTSPSPANSAQHAQNQYSQNLRNQLQNQMQQVANHGSPALSQTQPTPQQQIAQLQRQQQTAAQGHQMNPQMGQQMSPQQQQMIRQAQMQQQMQHQAQLSNMTPQQQAQYTQHMMMQQQQRQAAGQMSHQQMAAMQQQQRAQYPPQMQAAMVNVRDKRVAHHQQLVANERYGGNQAAIQPQEHLEIKQRAMAEAQAWARKQMAQQRQVAINMAQAQAQGMMPQGGQMPQ